MPRCLYGAAMLCKCFIPPELSAGKNFMSLQPCSSACSISLGVIIPGAKGSPASHRGVDYPYIATGAYAEIGATALGFARLFGRKDSPHAESERQSRAGYRRNALESPLRAERHFKRCDAAVAKRLCEVNGSGGIVYGKHRDDARLL